MVLQNLFERFETIRDAPKIVDLQLGAPTASNFTQVWPKTRTAIKQMRVLVGFILQPEMKLPKIVPDPN